MKKVLIAVDSTRDSQDILSLCQNALLVPAEAVLVHVEQLEGNAMMTAMLGDAEMSTLKEAVRDTEYKERLDARAEKILALYARELEKIGMKSVKTVIREGHPAEEILRVSREEEADLILLGNSKKSWLQKLLTGSVAGDVERNATMPVMIANGGSHGHAQAWNRRADYVVQ